MKRFLIVTASIIGLLLLIIVAVPFLFKDKIIAGINNEINKNLNAKIGYNPDIEISIIRSFPNLGVALKDVYVAGVNDFEGDTLISWKKLSVSLDIMSVIKGETFDIRSITLDDARIHALMLANGTANWNITKPSVDTTTTTTDTASTSFHLKLKRLTINNANIVYDDKVSGIFTKLEQFNYNMSGDFSQDEFMLNIISSVQSLQYKMGGITFINKVNTQIKADIDMDMKQQLFTFKDNEIGLNALKFAFEGFIQLKGNDIDMDIKYNAAKATFKDFLSLIPGIYQKDFEQVKTAGTLGFNGFAKGTYNEQSLPAFALNVEINNAMFSYPNLPMAVKDVQVKLGVNNKDGQLNSTEINLSKLHANVGGDAFEATLLANNLMNNPFMDATLLGRINLDHIGKIVPMEDGIQLSGLITSDIKAKGTVSTLEKQNYEAFNASGELVMQQLSFKSPELTDGIKVYDAKLSFTPRLVSLNNFDATIGKSDMKMNGELGNFFAYMFGKGIIQGKLNFSSNNLDLNSLIGAPDTTTTASSTDTATIIAPEIPANINFTLNSNINNIQYTNLDIKQFKGTVQIADQKLMLKQVGMEALGALFNMNCTYETSNLLKPTIALDLDIKNLDFKTAFNTFNTIKNLAPIAENMEGKFSTSFSMKAPTDKHLNPILNQVYATGNLIIPDAAITNVKLFDLLASTLKNDKYKSVGLKNVNIQFAVENGKITTQPFTVNAGGQSLNLSGTTGIDQTIDYKGTTAIPTASLGAVNAGLQQALGQLNKQTGTNLSTSSTVNLALGINGTFSEPKITTNLAALAKNEATNLKQQALDELDKQKKALEAKAKEEMVKAEAKLKEESEKAKQRLKEESDKAKAEAEKQKKELERKAQEEKEKQKKALEEEAKKKLKGIFR